MCLVLGVCVCWTVSTSTWALLHSARISGVSRCVFLFLAYINLNQFALPTSVRQLRVPLMVTLLWLSMVAQMLMASPGT